MLRLAKLTRMPRRTALLSGVVLVAIVAGALALTHHKSSPAIPSSNPLASGTTSNTPTSTNQPSAQNTQNNTSSATPSGPPPITPSGDFVSNHHPGGSNPTSEASTCNTSVGASCYIQFTKDGVTKKLDAHTADARGAAIWYWDVSTAGLSSGTWTITAVATLNGQTRTANDVMDLVVQ